MQIERIYHPLSEFIKPDKVLVLYGPRRVGKTTLLKDFLKNTPLKLKLDSGDDIHTQQVFSSSDIQKIKDYVQGYDGIAIDEAQKIPGIGQGLKILVDNVANFQIIATGSSSFELAGQIGEPLTGRKRTLTLYPVSQLELKNLYNPHELKKKLGDFLVFGSYPEVITKETRSEKILVLAEILGSYLLKDILAFDKVQNSKTLLDLLRLLAFQIGSEVSLNELGRQLGIDKKTVSRYLDLLEKTFVIYNLRSFSRNLRKEIVKKSKYYFFDLGIRNAVISNFNNLELRNDQGQLWENFIFMERLKKRAYKEIYANPYFWRTWDQKEIDLIEEREGKLFGYEFKWNKKTTKIPKEWLNSYPEATFKVINQDNYLEFIS